MELYHTQIKKNYAGVYYRLFLNDLCSLLSNAGITPTRQQITAAADREEDNTGSTPETQLTVGRVIIYIEEHLTEELSLNKLAEEVRLSKYQLIRQFRDEKGVTPWKFLIGQRIARVKELLENGISPGQAAVEAGFYDQSHLIKVFRKETGLTPREYQEKNFKNRN